MLPPQGVVNCMTAFHNTVEIIKFSNTDHCDHGSIFAIIVICCIIMYETRLTHTNKDMSNVIYDSISLNASMISISLLLFKKVQNTTTIEIVTFKRSNCVPSSLEWKWFWLRIISRMHFSGTTYCSILMNTQ